MADVVDLAMRAVAHPVCWAILLNGVDDLFIDLNYYLRGLYREERRRITVEDLKAVEQKRIAIIVPAWQEAAVIQQMLENNLQTLDYDPTRYDIFVGTYRNDEETQERVESVARRVANVHKVVTPHDGPTSKADCLNWVYQGLQLVEERRGQRFDILLMHDAEDIIHPLALRLYNYLIPDHDFVQTPVLPLETPLRKWVAATYKDEFAEHHLKDMIVRERVDGLVPSAGVGSAFARDAFEEIALAHSQEAFNPVALTEDYEIGTKFRLADKRVYFASRAIKRIEMVEKGWFRKRLVPVAVDEFIATREYFPDRFSDAVKQRTRWILGIGLQGWEQVGWRGPLPVLYCLWRDRKALLTNYVSILAYVVALYCIVRLVLGLVTGHPWAFDNIFPPGSVLWWIVMANTLVLLWRVVMKFTTVEKVYGVPHALLSIPRFFVSNVINFTATTRAIGQYTWHRITGEPLRWAKTAHVFPSAEALRTFRRRLGELLMDREGISDEELQQALAIQGQTGMMLGEVCTLTGMVTAHQVTEALGDQLALRVVTPDPFSIPFSLLQRMSEADARELNVLPLTVEADEAVQVAISSPPDESLRERLEEIFRSQIRFVFTTDEALGRARRRAYRRWLVEYPGATRPRRLGEALVDDGHITEEQLALALQEQATTGEPLGELVVRLGFTDTETVGRALAARKHGAFRAVNPGDVDVDALRLIGYGLCALHTAVPIRPDVKGDPLQLASAYPIHEEVRELVGARLGRDVDPVLAPALDVRLALALSSRRAWPDGIAGGVGGMDGVELSAIVRDPGWSGDITQLRDAARGSGRSPLDYLTAVGGASPIAVGRLRARALGIHVADPTEIEAEEPEDWLPPGWAEREDVQLIDLAPSGLVLAAPHPSPQLARDVAALFPDSPIAWRVAPARSLQVEQAGPVPSDQPPATEEARP